MKLSLKLFICGDISTVMGYCNAKIGRRKVIGCVGKFGLSVRNERGDRLADLSQFENNKEHNVLITR